MPKIAQYEAPETPLRPSQRGYEAAMVSGRRIGQLGKEGSADIQRGITSIGSALESGEARKERAAAKQERAQDRAERLADRQEAREAKFAARQAREAKAADDELSRQEKNSAIVSHGQLMNRLTDEYNRLVNGANPADIPATTARWQKETFEPALQQWRESVTANGSGKWADHQVALDTNHFFYTQRAVASTAAGHAVSAQLGQLHNDLVTRVLNHPEEYGKAQQDWTHAVNGIAEHTPAGVQGGGQGPQGEVAATLKARGWSDAAIVGALNNAQAESGWKPENVNGSVPGAGGARGIFQFDPGSHLPLYRQGGGDWSPKSQAEYMAGVVEKEMPGYKDSTDSAQATRQFHLGFERPKDQSPAAQQLRINNTAQSQTYLGGEGGAAFSANGQVQVNNLNSKGLHDLAKARLYGTADKDPTAARALLANDPDIARYLTEKEKIDAPRYIDNRERLNLGQAKHDQLMQDQSARAISAQAALGYVQELHDQYGKPAFPEDWNKRVAGDPNLRPDEKQALVKMQERLGAQRDKGVQPAIPGWFGFDLGSTPEQRAQEALSNPGTLTDALRHAGGGFDRQGNPLPSLSPAQIIDLIANGNPRHDDKPDKPSLENLSTHDAEMLMWGIDPRNSGGEQTLAALNREITKAHETLAPRNPDGSVNEAGEAAFKRFMGEWAPTARGAIKSGNGLSVLDPSSPEYLLRDNKIQKYAAGHEDVANAARGSAGAAPELSDLFNFGEPSAAELANQEAPQVHGVGAPITEAQLSGGGTPGAEEPDRE